MVVLATLAYDFIDDVMITVHAAADPTAEDWSRMLADLKPMVPRLRASVVVAGDIKLNARQRKQLADTVARWKIKVAVLSESVVTRGIMRAIGWLGGPNSARPFDMRSLDPAMTYLEIPDGRRPQLRATIKQLASVLEQAGSSERRIRLGQSSVPPARKAPRA